MHEGLASQQWRGELLLSAIGRANANVPFLFFAADKTDPGALNLPLMPVALNTGTSYFDGPPLVSSAASAVHGRASSPSIEGQFLT